jgi:hypothetical protein
MQSTTPVVVACPCPGTPHAEDTVYLRDKLGLAGGATLQRLVIEVNQSGSDQAETSGRLAEAYLRVGVADWTFTDEQGRKVPVNPDTLQRILLDDFSLAMPVADRADELYLQPVLGFLLAKAASSSHTTTTNGSISQIPGGSRKTRTRSKRSSTSTTPTADTATTSG